MQILIVDDDELAIAALEHALVKEGHDVLAVSNGRQALDLLRRTSCRLVISDWIMPEMDGLDLCRQIRKGDFSGYVYIILLTGRHQTDDIVAGLSSGADDFITKPFEPAELCIRVRTGERILSLETRDVAIFAMAKLAESRDPETGEHLERVRAYCRLLAERFAQRAVDHERVDEGFSQLMYLTSPLHDIGKVGIPDSVLLKPGRLSDREFEIMKTHTTIGAETLEAAGRQYPGVAYLRLAKEIALTHHERFDGTGYPSGLRGHQIPLSGRIMALADAYDALTSKRVYKPAYPHEVALSIIGEERGKHFDPNVVEAFLEIQESFRRVLEDSARLDGRGEPRVVAAMT